MTAKRKVLIGNAWPYANGSLHLGHAACLIPGDVIARYHRAIGDDVCFVSGSDCHGTPITLKAEIQGTSPADIAAHYHQEFSECFQKLGISYDAFIPTTDEFHKTETRAVFKQLLDAGWLEPKVTEQTYCPACARFLPDRYVDGTCPKCGDTGARGDQCDACGALLTPSDLSSARCHLCGNTPEQRQTEHLFFRLSKLQGQLTSLQEDSEWRANAKGLTRRYLSEGLVDRAATRDIEWGVDISLPGYEGKRIYVWFEAVLGYLTACKWHFNRVGHPEEWRDYWRPGTLTYYVHGKDNIPFHTIIWPALLLALGNFALPTHIISSEYLTLEGRKISTSRNWAVWLPDFLSKYDPDALRYFLIAAGPETRDADFSWREYVERTNSELLGAYGNFVHRTLAFAERYLDGVIPVPDLLEDDDTHLLSQGDALFAIVGNLIEQGKLKDAIKECFEYVRICNRYYDAKQPWITRQSAPSACANTIFTCIQAIARLCQLLGPFLPFSSERIRQTLNAEDSGWNALNLKAGAGLGNATPPFARLDKRIIESELAQLIPKNA